ncbi:AAA family ATPase [Bradyrhizobium sp. UFLA 03-164]|uniref:histidine kinase n=1 Tax=Bradyrhizobium uaiense TaxID=2594946 RepID=A0A6P1BA57_9BRAD|nr:AAA family ATPase [Bradyrhizobium uaiense]
MFCRVSLLSNADHSTALAVFPAAEHPTPAIFERFAHEFELREDLASAWSARPIELIRESGRIMLLLEDSGGEPLDRLMGEPMETGSFLRLATGIAVALGKLHQRGLVHKDIKPTNILVNHSTGEVKLTGFGLTSRLPRERQTPEPPETIAGTLAYMAPEQTGRMNRSIDARSDLYALGVTLYQMLTGALPFTASEPQEWVHCHIARRPTPPNERQEGLPTPISEIVMKLLAKTPEERYQSAAGVERDFRHCLSEWELQTGIDPFELGKQDVPDRLIVPEKLYGREREVASLLAAFDRIIKSGAPEFVLVSGYSGIGKSSVVNELHRVLVTPRGLFASGKFDQYNRDVPYSTLMQAFAALLRPLLGKSDAELNFWRKALHDALDPNGRLMVDLVPELKLIIGDPPPVPELPPQQAQIRFQAVLRSLLGVFARAEHPLVLFLDDLQWLDAATLDLLEDILIRSEPKHLMLVGAYRDNEVGTTHPLLRKLETIGQAQARIQKITLAPLAGEHVEELISDALCCTTSHAAPLAQIVHQKTAGNPFFVVQFLQALAGEGLLAVDAEAARWSWDSERILAKRYTDNVADLIVLKLARLPEKTQSLLQDFACLGGVADTITLSMLLDVPQDEVAFALLEALRQELIERRGDSYGFVHDRVQEAVYSLIPPASRAATHLRIGRLLVSQSPPERREEMIFDIVNQLNRGASLMISTEEREQLAAFNLIAGKRAKASTAYTSALSYLIAGAALLPDDSWDRRRALIYQLELHRAECEFQTGEQSSAENRLTMLATRPASSVERANVTWLRSVLYNSLNRPDRAVEVCLEYLRHEGIEWSLHPTKEEACREYERMWSLLGDREIEELIDLPLMSDPDTVATVEVLTKAIIPAVIIDENLASLFLWRIVNLSLENGHTDASCRAYAQIARLAGLRFGDNKVGVRFGRLGYELVERRGLKRFQASTYLGYATVTVSWTAHLREARDLIRQALDAANVNGDLTYVAYSWHHLIANLLAAGEPLVNAQREAERGLAFVRKARFAQEINTITAQLALIRTLRGLTATFGSLNDEQLDEIQYEHHLSGTNPGAEFAAGTYWTGKLQARFHAGDYAAAIDASLNAQRLLRILRGVHPAEVHFYGALSLASSCDTVSPIQDGQHIEALAAHHKQLLEWAENCPDNFDDRAALVGAEIARLEGRALEAMELYQRAIRSANASGFVQNEALAYELAARFYAARGFDEIAHIYLRNARYCYLRWGADGKVKQLDRMYPQLGRDETAAGSTNTIGTAVEQLDLATVIRLSQAVSGEIVPQKLTETLMRTAVEQAGAERGLLILLRDAEPKIEAEAMTGEGGITVNQQAQPVTADALPLSMLQYVLRTREIVLLEDAVEQPSAWATDTYIRERRARSVLCLPLINQAKLIGVLYLENNLSPKVFVPARMAALKLLVSQAAISLENTYLYDNLVEREARIRRLVDANIIGIYLWKSDGRIVEANDAFLRMVGYDREDLDRGGLRWMDITPAEWIDRDKQLARELRKTGSLQPFEKEYFRKDGSRVRVLMGATLFEQGAGEGVAFVLDLTERKRVEDALRQSEARNAAAERELRLTLDTIPALTWRTGPDGSAEYLNKRWLDYTGMTLGQALGWQWATAIHPDDLARLTEVWRGMLASQKPGEVEARMRRFDGVYRWFLFRTEILRDETGAVVGWYGTNTDIEDRKQAEGALKRNEAYAAEAQKLSRTGSVVWDVARENYYWSDEAYQIIGFDRTVEPSLDLILQRVHPDDRTLVLNEVRRVVEGEQNFDYEHRLMMDDGQIKYVKVRARRVRHSPGNEEIVGALMDITAARKSQEALHTAQTALAHSSRVATLGEMSASIAHEVNQPLAAIVTTGQACLRFLKREPPELNEVRGAVEWMVKNSNRASEVIRRVRGLSSKSNDEKSALDVKGLIEETAALLRHEFDAQHVALVLELQPDAPQIFADRVQIQQVVINLVMNGIDAVKPVTDRQRLLVIRSHDEAGHVIVSVKDNGVGISVENEGRLFDAFYTTKPGGLGIGLSICRSIIADHGGRLSTANNGDGLGATFQFALPIYRQAQNADPAPAN